MEGYTEKDVLGLHLDGDLLPVYRSHVPLVLLVHACLQVVWQLEHLALLLGGTLQGQELVIPQGA